MYCHYSYKCLWTHFTAATRTALMELEITAFLPSVKSQHMLSTIQLYQVNIMDHDRQYSREMLAKKDLNWFMPNARLYSEAFTSREKAIPRCPHCFSEGYCPFNFNPQGNMGWPLDLKYTGSRTVTPLPSTWTTPICHNIKRIAAGSHGGVSYTSVSNVTALTQPYCVHRELDHWVRLPPTERDDQA